MLRGDRNNNCDIELDWDIQHPTSWKLTDNFSFLFISLQSKTVYTHIQSKHAEMSSMPSTSEGSIREPDREV